MLLFQIKHWKPISYSWQGLEEDVARFYTYLGSTPTYATRLLRANYSPDRVKYLLGHASIQTTLDVYSHVIEEANLWEVIEREEE